jgi:hypothetical protein
MSVLTKADLQTLAPCVLHERLKNIVRESIEALMDNDLDLISVGAHEQAIFHRLAVYLEHRAPEFHVDCEYNRREGDRKRIGNNELIRPDVLIHERMVQSFNVLAVEGKANANPDTPQDMRKLRALAQQHGGFDYRLGVFIRIHNAIEDLTPSGLLRTEVTWVLGNSTNPDEVPEDQPLTRELNEKHRGLVLARHR